ncbi:dihydrofolate reductase family protein [Mucilaginibacter ginkgonis]|uniref:Dihydrofolate reductase family protein n=1 Tax=Mucilaginibacter ginkgonis TaxID=2682091 RepID=A0A6I4HVM0_9SPHI|nr:dihydrofolate reductase family protein [Mucilaginibacter ginkgonis]QQL50948.1 dihydrofolate reductase family protein [Mucilaginibacter ginkgonis]
MRKIKIIEHISLDGVIEHDNEYVYGAWTVPYRTPAGMAMLMEAQGQNFDLLVGRRTYDALGSFWPTAQSPIAAGMNNATKYVATHRPKGLEWGPAESLGTDIINAIKNLKNTYGPDLVIPGSASLTTLLLGEGLIDELVLVVSPVLLGKGKRLFTDDAYAQELEFVSTKTTPTGVLLNTYKYVGKLKS